MKKIFVCLALFALLGFSGYAEKKPKIFALECNTGMFLTYGISADLDFNFGSFFAFNGLSLYASFIWNIAIIPSGIADIDEYSKYSGLGVKMGLRYFFGQSGLDGIFLGLIGMTNDRVQQPSSAKYGSGEVLWSFRVLGGEVGYRFIIFDYMTLTMGIFVGGFLDQSGGGTINWDTAKTGRVAPTVYSSRGWTNYFELIIGLGFAL
jgi:hypothetical protein